jgi:nicotinamide-nucleotide amidase
MNAEIIAIGSELLLGQIIDTNSSTIAKFLKDNGIELTRITAVEDDLRRIKEVIKEATQRVQIVITTGGLGPTEDDLTREAVAQTIQRPLIYQPHLMEQIETLIKGHGFRMAESNRRQAYIPEGAIPIENPKGTAPGFIVENSKWVILSIPGVPLEMEYLLENKVIPYLRERFNLQYQVIRYRVLHTCGLGESAIGLQIKDLMKESKNPSVGTLASIGDIKIRITAKADHDEEALVLIQKMEKEIRNRLGSLVYGVDNETLQGIIVKKLEMLDLDLSIVETFTGGIISQKLTSTNSPSFAQGMVLPIDQSQKDFLEITEEEFKTLYRKPGKLANLLAKKARNDFKTKLCLAMHGKIAEKQGKGEFRIETYYTLSSLWGEESIEYNLGGELLMLRERTSIIALDMLRKYLLKMMDESA